MMKWFAIRNLFIKCVFYKSSKDVKFKRQLFTINKERRKLLLEMLKKIYNRKSERRFMQ